MRIESMNSVIKKLLLKKNVHSTYMKNGKLIVRVSKKEALADLKNQDIVPRYLFDGTRTDVIEAKPTKYLSKARPLIGGISCVNSDFGGATLGGLVRDSLDGQIVGLTNNHAGGVLFDIEYDWPVYGNTALSHIEMWQPSPIDGGVAADNIGPPKRAVATQFGPLGDNTVDATIIDLAIDLARTDIKSFGQGPFPFSIYRTEYPIGTLVYKYGRTTGLTEGIILSNEVNLIVTNDDDDKAYYYGQIMIEGTGDHFGEAGDSGSIVLMKSQGIWKIIGLLFAGSSDDTLTYANHIGDISTLLQIEAWNGNIIIDSAASYARVAGRCYKYLGSTLNVLSHTEQQGYTNCSACKSEAYPSKKVHMVT